MVLIAGFGDEVVQFLAVVFLLVIAVLAWLSTQISERPLIRTLVIVERQQPRQTSSPTSSSPSPSVDDDNKPAEEPPDEVSPSEPPTDQLLTGETMSENNPQPRTEELSTIRNRRLAFFDETAVASHNENLKSLLSDSSEGASASVPSVDEESTPSAPSEPMDEPDSANDEIPSAPQEEVEEQSPSIRIRLKYINDDLKLVEGSLEEQVGDFKKRHFSPELSCRKVVRLIFNGQQLGQDSWTLRNYGLYDNCVVHCLVNQPRTPPPSPNLNARSITGAAAVFNSWAISNILLASLSLLLCLAWFGRYQYAQWYTATTTVALVGLTGIFTISLIGLYMPEPASR